MTQKKMFSNEGLKTTFIGIVVSALLAVLKGVGGILGHSYALVADAIESGADVFTSTMLWVGLKWSSKPADKNHPYGHGKGEALIALGIAIALVLAAGIIIRDSILHIMNPHKSPEAYTLIILVAVILTKELLYQFVMRKGKALNSDAVKADAFHHRSDAITSLAAFIGISIALIGGEGYEVADDYAALLAGGIIIYNAYTIARPAIGELLDEEMDATMHEEIKEYALEVKGVLHVEKSFSRKMGAAFHVDLHIWVNKSLSVEEGHNIAHAAKDNILDKMPIIKDVHIHVEPYNINK